VSPVSTKPSESSALPPEFSHKALQSLVRRGRTSGSVTGEQVAEALRAADVTAARGRVVLRALGEQGIVVAAEQGANGVAAATTRTPIPPPRGPRFGGVMCFRGPVRFIM